MLWLEEEVKLFAEDRTQSDQVADQKVADTDATPRKQRQERLGMFPARLRQPSERRNRRTRFAGLL